MRHLPFSSAISAPASNVTLICVSVDADDRLAAHLSALRCVRERCARAGPGGPAGERPDAPRPVPIAVNPPKAAVPHVPRSRNSRTRKLHSRRPRPSTDSATVQLSS
jgi:hypothetical protein